MRSLLLLTLIFPFVVSAQHTGDHTKISKSKIQSAKSVREIISEVPADCLINSFELTANMNGAIATAKNNSDDFNATTKDLIGMMDKGSKFYISKFDSKCPDKLRKEYSFVVTD